MLMLLLSIQRHCILALKVGGCGGVGRGKRGIRSYLNWEAIEVGNVEDRALGFSLVGRRRWNDSLGFLQ